LGFFSTLFQTENFHFSLNILFDVTYLFLFVVLNWRWTTSEVIFTSTRSSGQLNSDDSPLLPHLLYVDENAPARTTLESCAHTHFPSCRTHIILHALTHTHTHTQRQRCSFHTLWTSHKHISPAFSLSTSVSFYAYIVLQRNEYYHRK
jgi:hypothetical protein